MKASKVKNRIVFVDRDGVINENRDDYVKFWEEFKFIEGAKEAIKLLKENGFTVIVISNQSAIGRGLTTIEEVEKIHRNMVEELRNAHAFLDAIYYCPHKPDDGCECRKPRIGLLLKGVKEFRFNLRDAWIIGDNYSDIELGNNAGCRTLLVLTGLGKETAKKDNERPTCIKSSLLEAAIFLVSDTKS